MSSNYNSLSREERNTSFRSFILWNANSHNDSKLAFLFVNEKVSLWKKIKLFPPGLILLLISTQHFLPCRKYGSKNSLRIYSSRRNKHDRNNLHEIPWAPKDKLVLRWRYTHDWTYRKHERFCQAYSEKLPVMKIYSVPRRCKCSVRKDVIIAGWTSWVRGKATTLCTSKILFLV